MRRLCYQVAMSLDGYIAGPNGEYDWIPLDPDIDFGALYARFDTLLMGRKTYEVVLAAKEAIPIAGKRIVVASKTLDPAAYPEITILRHDVEAAVAAMRAEPGQDIWLFGGGVLFRDLLNASLVDTVEVAVIPTLLGGGIPLLSTPAARARLKLVSQKVYQSSGIVSLDYEVAR